MSFNIYPEEPGPVIPIYVLRKRLTKQRDALAEALAQTPWWKVKRRCHLAGAGAAIAYEISQIEKLEDAAYAAMVELGDDI